MTDESEEPTLAKLSRAFARAMGKVPADSEQSPSDAEQESERGTGDDPSVSDPCPISPQTIVESILFVGHPENEPISGEAIAKQIRGVDVEEVAELVETLNDEYETGDYPFLVTSTSGGYRIELRDEYAGIREGFYGRVREARLSQVAIDVLAVVAYNQPVTREKVEKIINNHGVNTGRVLNQLVRRDLLAKRLTDSKPRIREYVTTGPVPVALQPLGARRFATKRGSRVIRILYVLGLVATVQSAQPSRFHANCYSS